LSENLRQGKDGRSTRAPGRNCYPECKRGISQTTARRGTPVETREKRASSDQKSTPACLKAFDSKASASIGICDLLFCREVSHLQKHRFDCKRNRFLCSSAWPLLKRSRSRRRIFDSRLERSHTAAAAERSPFLGDELSAGSLGCGNDLVEALITAQIIPARIDAEIAI
jgi:hypothetical protein